MSDEIKPLFVSTKQGLIVLAVFFFVAPPVQLFVLIMLTHSWIGGRALLIEMSDIIQYQFLPRIMASYIYYMPICFVAGLWAAYRPAQGRRLTLRGAVGRMVAVGAVFELIFQATLLSSGIPLMGPNMVLGLAQWLVSGLICGLIVMKLQKMPSLSSS